MASAPSKFKFIRRGQLNQKKKELIRRIRQRLNLSEVDASDKDLLECFGNTTLAESIRFAIAGEKLQQILQNQYYSKPFRA
jgi:hypothetical protein